MKSTRMRMDRSTSGSVITGASASSATFRRPWARLAMASSRRMLALLGLAEIRSPSSRKPSSPAATASSMRLRTVSCCSCIA